MEREAYDFEDQAAPLIREFYGEGNLPRKAHSDEPFCTARTVPSLAQSYYSHYQPNTPGQLTHEGVSVGGGGALGYDRMHLAIAEDCSVALKFGAAARAGGQRFPSREFAPWVSIAILDGLGNVVRPMFNTAHMATVTNCGGWNAHEVALDVAPNEAKRAGYIAVHLSGAKPDPC